MEDPYLHLIDDQWMNIAMMYHLSQDNKPIVEVDVDSKTIYTYPAKGYIDTLTTRTRNEAKKQYEEACKNNRFILFIKDNRNKKLRSYIFDVPEY
jgi:hypothetical protein